jgi:WXXGXW repeat (2 copies)
VFHPSCHDRDSSVPRVAPPSDRDYLCEMSNWKSGLVGLFALASPVFVGPMAQAEVVVIHGPREAPPPPREEHYEPRRGYVWTGGHHEYRHHHYVWSRGRYVHERPGYDYAPGRWDRHEDHYDWHDGEWRSHR